MNNLLFKKNFLSHCHALRKRTHPFPFHHPKTNNNIIDFKFFESRSLFLKTKRIRIFYFKIIKMTLPYIQLYIYIYDISVLQQTVQSSRCVPKIRCAGTYTYNMYTVVSQYRMCRCACGGVCCTCSAKRARVILNFRHRRRLLCMCTNTYIYIYTIEK